MIISGRKVKTAFSKAAANYDRLAALQQSVGMRLLDSISGYKPRSILDVGMGTGWLTEKLCSRFPSSGVTGVDFALGMAEHARKKGKFHVILADAAALSFKDHSFDLVISNLAYQWVEDLSGAFAEVSRVMREGGVFYLSSFGPLTLGELFLSLRKGTGDDFRSIVPESKFTSKEDISAAMAQNLFYDIHVSSEIFKVRFKDVLSLLRWIKSIGANTTRENFLLGKQSLARAEEFYGENFSDNGKIYATFEVVWARGKK